MFEGMTSRDAMLPVLTACPPGKKEDGYLWDFEGRSNVPVLVLPLKVWDSCRTNARWEQFCDKYGSGFDPKLERAELQALARLSQAIQTGSIRIYRHGGEIRAAPSGDLKVYVEIEAARRARSKVPLPLDPPERWSSEDAQAEEMWNQFLPVTGNPFAALSEQLGKHTKPGRLTLWWSERKKMLRAGLYFERVEDAIFALFTLQVALPRGVGICERCGDIFERTRVARKYCSVRCGNYIRKNRERQKSRRSPSARPAPVRPVSWQLSPAAARLPAQ